MPSFLGTLPLGSTRMRRLEGTVQDGRLGTKRALFGAHHVALMLHARSLTPTDQIARHQVSKWDLSPHFILSLTQLVTSGITASNPVVFSFALAPFARFCFSSTISDVSLVLNIIIQTQLSALEHRHLSHLP